MKVQIRRIVPEAVIPEYAHPSDAGLDLVATSKEYDEMGNVVYGTGLAMEIPEGHVGLIFPRSSNSKKTMWQTNAVSVIDSGYRGEIFLKLRSTIVKHSPWNWLLRLIGMPEQFTYLACEEYEIGDRIGQLIIMPYPKIEFEQVDWLTPSDRGTGSYGSTGR